MFRELSLIAVAGAVGTLARYGLHHVVQRASVSTFPWGTLAVNVLGCFLFGVVWTLAEERVLISQQAKLIVLVGFMGAFTTFSTFAFDSGALMRDTNWMPAVANVLLENLLGIGAIFAGFAAGRMI